MAEGEVMTAVFEYESEWRDNRGAFASALADLQETAAAVGLVLSQTEDLVDGWPQVLRAEIRRSRNSRVLASLDVGLSEHGLMLLQTSPGEARMFSRFRARDRAFYLKQFCGLIEAALQAGAQRRRSPRWRGWGIRRQRYLGRDAVAAPRFVGGP